MYRELLASTVVGFAVRATAQLDKLLIAHCGLAQSHKSPTRSSINRGLKD